MNGTLMICGMAMLALAVMAMAAQLPSVKDAKVKITRALPGGAATVYATPGFDTGVTPNGIQPGEVTWQLTAPALAIGQLADASTMKYSILHDTVDPVDGSSVVLFADCIVQTGAGGAGAVAATYKFRVPADGKRILSFRVVNSAAADASAAIATLEALF